MSAGSGDARSCPTRGNAKGCQSGRRRHRHAQPRQLLPVGGGIAGRLEPPAVPGPQSPPQPPLESQSSPRLSGLSLPSTPQDTLRCQAPVPVSVPLAPLLQSPRPLGTPASINLSESPADPGPPGPPISLADARQHAAGTSKKLARYKCYQSISVFPHLFSCRMSK